MELVARLEANFAHAHELALLLAAPLTSAWPVHIRWATPTWA
ncbi:hypothetical protein ACWDZ6_30015 [Streptomyces sp. NPDC002926]